MANNKGMPRKKDIFDYAPYIVIGVAVLFIGIWFGFVLDETASPRKGVQFGRALEHLREYMTLEYFIKAPLYIFTSTTVAVAAFYSLVAGAIIVLLGVTQNEKRLHRKGEEHGSARWGTDEEKKLIADTEDFYNNVILADDIFLVLDRKQRDKNYAAKGKGNKKKAKKKPLLIRIQDMVADNKERKRIAKLEADIDKYINSPLGNLKDGENNG